jgi:regulatory protein
MADNEFFKTALNKAMALCAGREYTAGEIASKLKLWGLETNENGRIIQLLKNDNFINEERYALAFVKDKFRYNKWGKLKISAHLRSKNVSDEVIRKALDSIDDETYRKTIEDIISAHRRSVKAKNQYDLKAKLLRYGLSKGFESHLLYDILNMIEE